ncbi:hypothetical protein HDV00_000545 [Rhizophlyctis rosea]|nr:hypothetical protein HDV00_000545 [Rhizophlyctis rosea]
MTTDSISASTIMGVCHSSEPPAATTKPSPSMTQKMQNKSLPLQAPPPNARPRADSFKFDTAGRRLHADFTPLSETAVASDRLYMLPNDDEEMDRLHMQHYVLQLLFGSNFSAPVTKLLSDPRKQGKALDLGCGSGIWAFETATAFPTCHVTGMDLSPVQPSTVKPKNVEFMVGDLTNLPLPFPDVSFDFVHMRLLFLALRAEFWPVLITEIVRIVKPGGWVEFLEPSCITMEGATKAPNLLGILVEGQQARGIDVAIASRLEDYLLSQSSLKDVQTVRKVVNMRPDPTNEESVRLAKMMGEDVAAALTGVKGAFLAKGVCREEEFDGVVREHVREMEEVGHTFSFTRCFGRKVEGMLGGREE